MLTIHIHQSMLLRRVEAIAYFFSNFVSKLKQRMIQINEQRGKIFKETEVLHRWESIVKAKDEGPTLEKSD